MCLERGRVAYAGHCDLANKTKRVISPESFLSLAGHGQRALLSYATIPVLLCVLTLLINLVLQRSSLNTKAVDLAS